MTLGAAVALQGINKSFGATRALIDIDFTLTAGRRHALVGPNGSGKTTLLRLMAGLLTPESGKVNCLGLEWQTNKRTLQREVAYVAQRFSLYDELTIEENCRFVAGLYDLARNSEAYTHAQRVFGLLPYLDRRAEAVSAGIRQRLMLAAAIMRRPKLLLLDEATAALDAASRSMLREQIAAAHAIGATVVLTTHAASDTEWCDSITELNGGRIVGRAA